MKVLVSAASKHGSTTEVAATVAAALMAAGLDVTVVPPSEVTSLDGFDAAVVGSAVYVGRWMEPARDLLERQREGLRKIPVWLFSSGPIGDPPKPVEESVDEPEMVALVQPRGHHVFAGRIDKRRLGLGEKAIMAAVRAPEGDYRPWPEIEAWARSIAEDLQGLAAATRG